MVGRWSTHHECHYKIFRVLRAELPRALCHLFAEEWPIVAETFSMMHGGHTGCCLRECYDTASKQNTGINLAPN